METNAEIVKMLDIAASEEFTDLLAAICKVCSCACDKQGDVRFVASWNVACRQPLFLLVKTGEKPVAIEFDPKDKSYFVQWSIGEESGFLYFCGDEEKFLLPESAISAIETGIRINVEAAVKKVEWGVEAATRILGITYHDVRNAFGTISGVAQLLEMDEGENERVSGSLSSINEILGNFDVQSKTLMYILRNEPINYENEPVDVSSLYNGVLVKNKRVYRYSQVELDFEVEENIKTRGDEPKIAQILSELLLNASDSFENSDKGGKITVRVFTRDSECVVSVKDTGFGIDYDSQRYLTTKFFTRKFKRPGLGLAKVRRFVEDWGGRFLFSSEPEKGTFVEAKFPIVP
jgi:signal transduction histidine kinase